MKYENADAYWTLTKEGIACIKRGEDGWSLYLAEQPLEHGWPSAEEFVDVLSLAPYSGIEEWDAANVAIPRHVSEWHVGLPPSTP